MLVITAGAVVGRVVEVLRHPNADRVRLAWVDLGDGNPVQIVWGGPDIVRKDSLVPVAPPGARLFARGKAGKMRRRNYRGQSSYGMLCSLAELGWQLDGPDEVALLWGVTPGEPLDGLATGQQWRRIVRSRSEVGGAGDGVAYHVDELVAPAVDRPLMVGSGAPSEHRAQHAVDGGELVAVG